MSTATLTDATKTLGSALIEALGLPQNVTRLTLTLDAGKPPVVECEYFPTDIEGAPISALNGRFELVEIDGEADQPRTDFI